MNKKLLLALAGLVILVASASAQLRSGEAAIFFRSGDVIIDRVVDISSTRLVLQTANSGEFQLREVWMINYDRQAGLPGERDEVETDEHYVFLKNGRRHLRPDHRLQLGSARLPASERATRSPRAASAACTSPSACPSACRTRAARATRAAGWGGQCGPRHLSGRVQQPQRRVPLDEGGGARLMFNDGGQRRTMNGSWSLKRGEEAIVVVNVGTAASRQTMTFGRDGQLLIGIVYDKDLLGALRMRRQ